MALLMATLCLRNPHAPIKDWIEAIKYPDEDQTSRVARFTQWGEDFNLTICDMDGVAIAMKQTQCFPTVSNADMMWQPDTAYYRKTAEFKDFVNTHLMEYWQKNGFPPQCQALEDGDFTCD